MPNITVRSTGSETVLRRRQVKEESKAKRINKYKRNKAETCTEKLRTKKKIEYFIRTLLFLENHCNGKNC